MTHLVSKCSRIQPSLPQLKQFDVGDVENLVGRYSHVEHGIKMDGQAYLQQFYNERSLHKRLAMIRQARKGGAITPEAYVHLQPFIQSGQVELRTFCQVMKPVGKKTTAVGWAVKILMWLASKCLETNFVECKIRSVVTLLVNVKKCFNE